MVDASVLAQENSVIPEAGGGAIIVWVLLALVIVGLYLVIRRSQRRSYEDFITRDQREREFRANDPDMKHDDAPRDPRS